MIKVEGYQNAKSVLTRKPLFQDIGSVSDISESPDAEKVSCEKAVSKIIADVRDNGDAALFNYARELDGAVLTSLEVTRDEINDAYKKADKTLISALEIAAKRIRDFHSVCKGSLSTSFISLGVGRQIRPLNRVGIYVPGGTAAYPSTVLMTAVPARVAGVEEIVMMTPPHKDGSIPAPTLIAADMANVNRIFKSGGAQAIAAMAFGTVTIPKVDKICGPGNIYVAAAKKAVYGIVDIDGIQGPSEVIVLADETAPLSFCAADLIAQAEHDALASAILITTSKKLADEIEQEIKKQAAKLGRRDIIMKAMDSNGVIVHVENMDEAIELVNFYAPEHLLVMVTNPSSLLGRITSAGCIFLGECSPVAVGDYIAGPSHVLPTGGSARYGSPLGIEAFMKITSVVAFGEDKMKEFSKTVIDLATAEGLDAHAAAIKVRIKNRKKR